MLVTHLYSKHVFKQQFYLKFSIHITPENTAIVNSRRNKVAAIKDQSVRSNVTVNLINYWCGYQQSLVPFNF